MLIREQDDGTLTEDHAFQKWNNYFYEGCAIMKRDHCPGQKLLTFAKEAGFENIRAEKFKVPIRS